MERLSSMSRIGSVILLCAVLPLGTHSAEVFSTDVYRVSSSTTKYPNNRHDSVEHFLSDLEKLSSLQNGDIDLLRNTHSKRDSSYTKSWSFPEWERHQAEALIRYRRHLATWITSPTALAVLPAVGALVAWALFVLMLSSFSSTVHEFLRGLGAQPGGGGLSTMASFNAPIALLLTLRTNRSLDRLLEARQQWGVTTKAVTSLTGMSQIYYNNRNEEDHEAIINQSTDSSTLSILMGRYLALYGWSMKGLFRGEDDTAVIQLLLPPHEAAWLLHEAPQSTDRPTAILFRLRSLVHSKSAVAVLTTAQQLAMEDRLAELESSLGICKRLLGSPVPPTYTRHLGRVLVLYLGLLPFGSVVPSPSQLPWSRWWSVLLHVALTAYIMIGLDEISVEIEHPFPILPLFHLSRAMRENVTNQIRMSQCLPALPPTTTMDSSSGSRTKLVP